MNVTVRTRHGYVPASLKQEAQERLRKLERYEARPTKVHLVFEEGNDGRRVETRLVVTGGGAIVASAVAPNFRDALDHAIRRTERQLKRKRERSREYTAPKVMSTS